MKIINLGLILSMLMASYWNCLCTGFVYKPVCGNNGKTYYNRCLMFCDKQRRAHKGVCRTCKCPDIIQPVCAEDGHTYINSCEANCHNSLVVAQGRCDTECTCPDFYDPVCGANGKTYNNYC